MHDPPYAARASVSLLDISVPMSQILSWYAFLYANRVARLPVRVSPWPPERFRPPSPSDTSVCEPLDM